MFVHSYGSNAMLLAAEHEDVCGFLVEGRAKCPGDDELDSIAQQHLDPVTTAKLNSLGTEYEVRRECLRALYSISLGYDRDSAA